MKKLHWGQIKSKPKKRFNIKLADSSASGRETDISWWYVWEWNTYIKKYIDDGCFVKKSFQTKSQLIKLLFFYQTLPTGNRTKAIVFWKRRLKSALFISTFFLISCKDGIVLFRMLPIDCHSNMGLFQNNT